VAESRGEYSIVARWQAEGALFRMKILVGLGNPGRNYAATRHNLGFLVVEHLADRLQAGGARQRFQSIIAEGINDGEKIVFVKPQTYMNLSGHAVREIVSWYRASPSDLLVLLDDLDLGFGTIRLRGNGSAGGHNGLFSVIEQLGASEVPRLRIGIGRGHSVARTQVLSRFTEDEQRELPLLVASASDCAVRWMTDGLISAMNQCNRREPPERAPVISDKPNDKSSE